LLIVNCFFIWQKKKKKLLKTHKTRAIHKVAFYNHKMGVFIHEMIFSVEFDKDVKVF